MTTKKLTVRAAAAEIGITHGRLTQMIRAGECKAHKRMDKRFAVGYCYEIAKSEVNRIKKIPRTVGRPRISDVKS